MNTAFGVSRLYMAPEVARGDSYDCTADIWSLGCIFYYLLVGCLPFEANNAFELVRVLEEGIYFLPKFVEVSEDCVSILTGCLQYDAKKRFNWRELISDSYFTDENFECYFRSNESFKQHTSFM